jgi:hypothetical protein
METLFNIVSLALFAAAILTIVRIVRDVFQHLDEQDQAYFRTWVWCNWPKLPVKNAWKEHIRLFPKSRKRLVFAFLVILASLSVMGYPLWLAVSPR